MMKKILNNRYAVLVIAVLLLLFSVAFFLGALEVRAFSFMRDVLRLLVAAVLISYAVLFLGGQVRAREGVAQKLIVGEMAVLFLLALSQAFVQFFDLPLFSSWQVCAVLGFVVALRFFLEIVMAYLAKTAVGGTPIWLVCLYLLGFGFGVWQMASPAVRDKHFLFVLGACALLGAGVFAFFTVKGFRVSRKASVPTQLDRKRKTALPSGKEEG